MTSIPIESIRLLGAAVVSGNARGVAVAAHERIPMLDVMRFAGALGVIWVHSVESAAMSPLVAMGRYGTPFFVLIAIFFVFQRARNHPEQSFASYAWSRFLRLYPPFLVWTLLYLAVRNVKFWAMATRPVLPLRPYHLWVGSSYHLWFLPSILVLLLMLFPLARWVSRRESRGWIVAAIGLAVGVAAVFVPAPAWLWDQPMTSLGRTRYMLGRMWFYLPGIFWGTAVAAIYPKLTRNLVCNRISAASGLVFAALCMVIFTRVSSDRVFPNLAGLGCLAVAAAPWDAPWLRRVAGLGRVTFGIYLSHVMFVEGMQSVAYYNKLQPSPGLDICVFLASVAGSVGLALVLSRIGFVRRFVM